MGDTTIYILVAFNVIVFMVFVYYDHRNYKRAKQEFLQTSEFFTLSAAKDAKFEELMDYYDYVDNQEIVTEDDLAKLSVLSKEYDKLFYEHDKMMKEQCEKKI